MKIDSQWLVILLITGLAVIGLAFWFLILHNYQVKLPAGPQKNSHSESTTLSHAGIQSQSENLNTSTARLEMESQTTAFSGLFFGDLMLDRNVGAKIKQNGLDSLFKKLGNQPELFDPSLNVVSANLEGVTTDQGAHYPPELTNDFAFDPLAVAQLAKYRFNFFNLANNHFADQSLIGEKEARSNLARLGFNFSGCSDRQLGDCSSQIIPVNGLKVGMIGFSLVYGRLDTAKAQAIVRAVKSQTDLVVINVHWGQEYSHIFTKQQSQLAHALIEAGADAIIGHHPHVIQGVEIYRQKPIFYSLGNFIFDQYFSTDTQQGLAIKLAISDKLIQAQIFPLREAGSVPALMTGKERQQLLDKVVGWSSLEANRQVEWRLGSLIIEQN